VIGATQGKKTLWQVIDTRTQSTVETFETWLEARNFACGPKTGALTLQTIAKGQYRTSDGLILVEGRKGLKGKRLWDLIASDTGTQLKVGLPSWEIARQEALALCQMDRREAGLDLAEQTITEERPAETPAPAKKRRLPKTEKTLRKRGAAATA
jgi:hypothetical protein